MQNKADILNMNIEVPDIPEATSLGLAILAGLGSGTYKSLKDAAEMIQKPVRSFSPDSENVKIYEQIYNNIFINLYKTIKEISYNIRKYSV